MTQARKLSLLTIGVIAIGTIVLAQSAEDAVKLRKAHMTLQAAAVGVLGGMARGTIDYDAEAAQSAADDLVAITGLDQRMYWPEGSSNAEYEGTRAQPAIWANLDDFAMHATDLAAAAVALAAVAGDGLDPLKAAIGPVGAACGSCHETYRSR